MKILAILLMLLGLLLILGVGAMSLLLFAMAFDAPGSDRNPVAWASSALIFLPLLFLLGLLIWAFVAYQSGNYTRSVWIGSVFGFLLAGGFIFFATSSLTALRTFQADQAQVAEDARLYPEQRFVRPFEGGADTIIVFSSRIVAYRMPQRGDMPFAYSGPVGDLDESRKVIVLSPIFDRRIRVEEFPEFVDEQGRKLSDLYSVR